MVSEKVFKSPYAVPKIIDFNPSTQAQKEYNLSFFEYCAIKGETISITSSGAIVVGSTIVYTIPKDYTLLVTSVYYNCVFSVVATPITYLFQMGGQTYHSFASTIAGVSRNLLLEKDFRNPLIFRSGQNINFYVSGGPDTGSYSIQVQGILVPNSLIQI